MTQFDSIYGGVDCDTYAVDNYISYKSPYVSGEYDSALIAITFSQSRKLYISEWSVMSLDALLGIVGGFTALIWDLLNYSLGGYESFQFS